LSPAAARSLYPQIGQSPLIKSGDVHRLDEFLGVNQVQIEKPCIGELRKALSGLEDRTLTILETTESL
jgi:hypothetical protein